MNVCINVFVYLSGVAIFVDLLEERCKGVSATVLVSTQEFGMRNFQETKMKLANQFDLAGQITEGKRRNRKEKAKKAAGGVGREDKKIVMRRMTGTMIIIFMMNDHCGALASRAST